MSDSDARLKVTADTTGAVGPLDAVTAANKRVGESGKNAGREADAAIQALPPSYLKASAAVSEFAAQAEKGGKGAAKAAALADLALQSLEAEILDLRAAGKPTADLEAAMEGLRRKTSAATDQVGRFRAAAADAADKMKSATARAGETDGAITGLADAVKAANFALGEMVTKVGISLVVFKQAYNETRNLIDKMKEFGINVDSASLSFLNITQAAEEFVNAETKAQTASRENSEASRELAQIQSILEKRYNDTATSIEEAREKLQRHSRAAFESSSAIKEENEALFGKESALKSTTEALLGAIAAEEKEGTLTAVQVEIVKAALKSKAEEYQRAGQTIDAALQSEIDKRGVAIDAVAELADTTVSAAETRASAEKKAAEDIAAALAKQEADFLQMLEDTNKFVAERDKILNTPNKGFDSSQDADKAKGDLAKLNQQIKAIEDSPVVTEDQLQQLGDLKQRARDASKEVRDLGRTYTLANMNGEELAIKQNAAWEKYYAIRHANDAIVQRNTDKDLRALGDETDAVGELGDAATDTADAIADVELLQQKNFELNQVNQQGQKVYDLLAQSQTKANNQIVVGTGAVAQGEDAWTAYHKAAAASIAATDAAAGSQAALGDAASGAAVRIENLTDGTRRITNVADEMGGVFAKVGGILIEDFGQGELQIRNTGDAAEYLKDAAGDVATSLGQAADAGASLGDETKKGTDVAKEGIDGAAGAVETLKTTLEACEVVIDRIGTKLANLQLGS